MNHLLVYEKILNEAGLKNRKKLARNNKDYIYYENHHIIPRCVGGNDEKENLVLLVPKEHYLVHKLLTYIYRGNLKIAQAFFLMTFDKRKKIRISLRDYAYARELLNTIPALIVSDETKRKISKMLKMSPEERTLYKIKEKEKKKLDKWFKINCSEEAVEKYLNSREKTSYSPLKDPIIHISFKNKESNETDIEKIKQNIRYLNKQGCYVGTKV